MARVVPAPCTAEEMQRFLETGPYHEEAFLVDEVLRLDPEAREVEARLETDGRWLPFAAQQRVDARHPAHVAAGELLMATGSLGFLHAWFFHGCRWDEGWTGFGNRIHRADFKNIAHRGPPLLLHSRELRVRVGERRVVMRCEFHFRQGSELVYHGDQTAMFLRDRALAGPEADRRARRA